jgi:hypothetical protein
MTDSGEPVLSMEYGILYFILWVLLFFWAQLRSRVHC